MILFLTAIVVSVLAGYAFGGRLRRLEQLRLRWWGLVIAGLALQFVPLPDGRAGADLTVRIAVLSSSYALLLIFAGLNFKVTGMPLVLVGLAMNAAVIAPNGGMPVSDRALVRSGQADVLDQLLKEGAAKHHLLTDDDVLTPLADVIPLGGPIHQVVSVGDVFVYAWIMWLIVATMRGRIRQPSPSRTARYRGKHRPGRSADPPAPVPPPAATRSGSSP